LGRCSMHASPHRSHWCHYHCYSICRSFQLQPTLSFFDADWRWVTLLYFSIATNFRLFFILFYLFVYLFYIQCMCI
jgi:hypothetical protein